METPTIINEFLVQHVFIKECVLFFFFVRGNNNEQQYLDKESKQRQKSSPAVKLLHLFIYFVCLFVLVTP